MRLLILLFPILSYAADLPYCEDSYLNKTEKARESDAPYCEVYKTNNQLVMENYPDGTKHLNCIHLLKYPNDLQAELKKIETEIPARKARMQDFFKELKDAYKRMVDKSQNAFLLSRLDELELVIKPCPASGATQAQLMIVSNTIVMCEQMLILPREGLLTQLNHEIAHATDPCLFTVTAEFTFERHELEEKFVKCFGTLEGTKLANTFSDLKQRAQENFSAGQKFAPNSTSKAVFEKMKTCGMVKESGQKPPAEIKGHPFADIFQCTYADKNVAKMDYDPKASVQSFEASLLRNARVPNSNCTLEGTEEYAEAVGAFMSSQHLISKPPRAGYEKSVMAITDFMTCALNNPSRLHVAANKGMMMKLQYEPFQKIANCKLRAKADVCGRVGHADGIPTRTTILPSPTITR